MTAVVPAVIATVKTPLTYGDALALADGALKRQGQTEALARILMAVDVASRLQAQEYLIGGIAALGLRADEEGDQGARHLAAHLIAVANGDELPEPERE